MCIIFCFLYLMVSEAREEREREMLHSAEREMLRCKYE